MITEYGIVGSSQTKSYLSKLIGRIFKIIPMNEEQESTTLKLYVSSLTRELIGNSKIFFGEELMMVCGTLEGLNYEDHKSLRSDIFKAIGIVSKVEERE